MTAPENIKRRAIELHSQGLSVEKVRKALDKQFNHSSDVPVERTIYRWLKEAKEVQSATSETPSQQRSEPQVSKNWEEHIEHLAAMANTILRGRYNLIDTWENKAGRPAPYIIQDRGGTGIGANREELDNALRWDIWEACVKHSERDIYEILMPHLRAEHKSVNSKESQKVCDENPYDTIKILIKIARKQTFKGKCTICQDW